MPSTTNYHNQNYYVTSLSVHHDFEVSVLPVDNAIPSFNSLHKVIVRNNGNQVDSGTVQFTFDSTVATLAATTPDTSSSDQEIKSVKFIKL